MFAKAAALSLLIASGATLLAKAPAPPPVADLLAQCAGKDGWSDPAPPVRIYGSTYLVGTCGISAILITSEKGHVLIDGATAEAAPAIAANIERLGFRLRDVKIILSSHEHLDHVGGLAELQRRSGATVRASAMAGPVLTTGRKLPADPQAGIVDSFPPVRLGRALTDGETVAVGPLRLTAHLTPGHAPGGTSWSWRSCEGKKCVNLVFADSVTAVSADGYRFSDHQPYVGAFRASLSKIAALPCDILLTPHPGASNMVDRLAGKAPLLDRSACAAYAQKGRAGLDERLAKEAAR
jgi:metallo-beta-lactamase class B